MKEAVIKAHKYRRLFPRDVSIISHPRKHLGNSSKPYALIEPRARTVAMNQRTAERRGLELLHKLGNGSKSDHDYFSTILNTQLLHRLGMSEGSLYARRKKVQEEDRQVAEVSLSHERRYAVAVCMASDEDSAPQDGLVLVDDGIGDSIHVPEQGDRGWQDTIPKV